MHMLINKLSKIHILCYIVKIKQFIQILLNPVPDIGIFYQEMQDKKRKKVTYKQTNMSML